MTAWHASAEPGAKDIGEEIDKATSDTATAKGLYKREFDPKIAAASRKRVSEKVGGLRGTLAESDVNTLNDVDETQNEEGLSTRLEVLRRKPVTMQRRAWQKRRGEKVLPPMVDAKPNVLIDSIITGSSKHRPGIEMRNKGYKERAKKLNPYPVQ